MPTVLQLSDLHLGRTPEHEAQRCAIIADVVRAQAPDLVVISGDLCDDVPDHPEQIALGKRFVESIDTPVEVIPGNHDIGNKPSVEHERVTPERYALWSEAFGAGWFRRDMNGWSVLGLNSQILGSGWESEREQDAWLDEQLASCGRCVVFMHMPLDLPVQADVPEEHRGNLGYWPVDPGPREALLARLSSPKVRLLCSGHLHNHASLPCATPPRYWCPSLAQGVTIHGVTGVVSRGDCFGVVRHELDDESVATMFVPVALPAMKAMTI